MAIGKTLLLISLLHLVNLTYSFSLKHVMERLDTLEVKFEMENKLRRSETQELFRIISEIIVGGKMTASNEHASRGDIGHSDIHAQMSYENRVATLDRTTKLPSTDKNKTTEKELDLQKLKSYLLIGARIEKDENKKFREELKAISNKLTTDYAKFESKINEEIQNFTNDLSEKQISLGTNYAHFMSNIKEDMKNITGEILQKHKAVVTVDRFNNFSDFITAALSEIRNESGKSVGSFKSNVELSLQKLHNEHNSMNKTLTIMQTRVQSCRSSPKYNAVYVLYPAESLSTGIRIYCDQTTEGGGWIVFQRRQDGSVDFERTWADYKTGFGNLDGEFWLGNDNLHALTSAGFNELRIDMEDFEGNKAYAKYSYFMVKSEREKYALEVRGYSGDAGDSLIYHKGIAFYTKDRDNGNSCSKMNKGAWWYRNCHYSNLNGLYYRSANTYNTNGINWYYWQNNVSLKRVDMKIR